jgi:hypothetical protein
MSEVIINGQALAEFTFYNVPSWNTILGKHHMEQGRVTKSLRLEGQVLGQNFMRRFCTDRDYLVDRALIVVKVYPPHEGVMDIHNVALKAITDGFTDAMIFEDDEWAFVPVVVCMWGGIDPKGDRRTVIEVHRLDRLVIDGKAQVLPMGRTRTDDEEG